MMKTSLSVLVPVYNEQHLVHTSLHRLKILDTSENLDRIEVIVVDDCSTDDSPRVLERFRAEQTKQTDSKIEWTFLRHDKNRGKGRAIKTALERATCAISVIHDADLEYHPKDLLQIVDVFVEQEADAVYGSRFTGSETRRILFYRHQLGNNFLTFLSNLVTNLNVSDMETCYKAVRTPLLKSIPIESNDFRIEPELTIKLAKRNARIFEVPISYSGRTYEEGKKINWRDGFRALAAIVKFACSDKIYQDDSYRSNVQARWARTSNINAWLADSIRTHCGNRLLEIGSGLGNLTRRLIPRTKYVASDINPLYLHELEAFSKNHPYMRTSYCDITDISSIPRLEEGYDTVICLNMLENVDNDLAALRNLRTVLAEGGKAIVVVPHGQWNFGGLDEGLGRKRRYSKADIRKLAEACGFTVADMSEFNRAGTLAWFINGKILRRRIVGLFQISLLNFLTPLSRLVEPLLPFPGSSIIAVLLRTEAADAATAASMKISPANVDQTQLVG
jgi:glycosyltransferase involved in cell wall biosynthesis